MSFNPRFAPPGCNPKGGLLVKLLEAKERTHADVDNEMPSPVADQAEQTSPIQPPKASAPCANLLGWPDPPERAALHGLTGELVRTIEPHTEADSAAILLQLLVAVGSVVGRNPYFQVEATRHYLNLFVAIVGQTSKARKGTSWGHVDRIFRLLDEPTGNGAHQAWSNRLVTGLSSGEGLIWEIRDGGNTSADDRSDPGVDDKRRIVVDSEFASTLKVLARQGNTLSPVIRNAWDSGELRILTKNSPAKATGAHISVIGHITRDELRRELTATEQGNGFANRFLWCCAKRSKCLPDGGYLRECDLRLLVQRLREVLGSAQNLGEMTRDDAARVLWHKVYPKLSEGQPGMFGAVTARAEAQVTRIACLYALLDQSPLVRIEHLNAALAVWSYCEASARFIFEDSTGDLVADSILQALRRAGSSGLSRTGIRDLFQRNQNKPRIDEALALLAGLGLAEQRPWKNGSQQTEMWFTG